MAKENFKPGNIVVVLNGTASGNRAGTITKVVSLLTSEKAKSKGFGERTIACTAETWQGWRRYNETLMRDMGFKTKCWLEHTCDVRLATLEERKQYYALQQEELPYE